MSTGMTPQQEYDFYADPANQEPEGPPVRRRARMGAPIPVRLPEDIREQVKARAEADHRTVSNWIRLVIERELATGDDAVVGGTSVR
ncbi:Arc family DNA-binding protein [Georgenia subflava]|uniref:Arc family DNA-binding protein n=2 Tax=Georgenia subflava TaxID=1622177 RepID=A0A6N7EI89_9MICO|nr:Arc family DNA-binding protein [Georgenia subflava]